MLLTLKLVGLAFEVNQTYISKARGQEKNGDNEDLVLKEQYNAVEPNFLDILHYSFNYVGVLTGKVVIIIIIKKKKHAHRDKQMNVFRTLL